jgi:hypothetical protein
MIRELITRFLMRLGCAVDFWHMPASDADSEAPWARESRCVICGRAILREGEDWVARR